MLLNPKTKVPTGILATLGFLTPSFQSVRAFTKGKKFAQTVKKQFLIFSQEKIEKIYPLHFVKNHIHVVVLFP